MKTFVINLKRSKDRKEYMEHLLNPLLAQLDVQFVEAVDGRELSDEDADRLWDNKGTYSVYGREMKRNEIGCALSHRKCCEHLLASNDDVALILEDDLVWQDADIETTLKSAQLFLSKVASPTVILLSGDYWFWRKKENGGVCLATVREAVCAQAYLLNRAAAKVILEADRVFLADDWYSLKNEGFKLYAVYPHIADQNRRDFDSVLSSEYEGTIRKNLSFCRMMHSYYRAIVKRLLAYTGHIERKNFVFKG